MKRRPAKQLLNGAFDIVKAVGLALPDVEATTKYDGSPVLKVDGMFMAGLATHPSPEPGPGSRNAKGSWRMRPGHAVIDAAVAGAVLRLRPIMMTTLVATLGLLPAALSRGIGSDSQRPFAIVIVGGLVVAMVLNIFLLPTVYVWVAGEHDVLPAAEAEFDEEE